MGSGVDSTGSVRATPATGKGPTLPKVKSLLLPYEQNDILPFLSTFFTKLQTLAPDAKIRLDFLVPNYANKTEQIFNDKEITYKIKERNNQTSSDVSSEDFQDAAILYPSDLAQMVLDTIPLFKTIGDKSVPQTLLDLSAVLSPELTEAPLSEVRIYNKYKDHIELVCSEILARLDFLTGKTQINPEFEELNLSQVNSGEYFRVIETTLVPLLEIISKVDTTTTTKNRDFPIPFNGKQYSFAQIKTDLNEFIIKVNHDFCEANPNNSALSSIKNKLKNKQFVEKHISEVKALEPNSSSRTNRLRFIDVLPGYSLIFNKFSNDFLAFDSINPDAYLNTSDTETARYLFDLFVALVKLDGFSSVQAKEKLKEEAQAEAQGGDEAESKETLEPIALDTLLTQSFDLILEKIVENITAKTLNQAISEWGNKPENKDIAVAGLATKISDSLSKNETLRQQIYALFLQSEGVKAAQNVEITKEISDLVPFYDMELQGFVISDTSGELEKTYTDWLQVIFDQLQENSVELFLTQITAALETYKAEFLEKENEEISAVEEKKAQDLATSGIPANIAQLLEEASGIKISDTTSASAALANLQKNDPTKYRALQEQLFAKTGLHRDLHLRMQSAMLAQLKAQGFAFTSIDEIPLEIRTALFADIQNYLYELSPEELTRAFSDRTARSLLLADFNRRLLLGQLPISGVISQYVAANAEKINATVEQSNEPLTVAFRDYLATPPEKIIQKLYDPNVLSGYSPESEQSFVEYLDVQFKRPPTQQELDWVNEVLLFYAQQYANQQSYDIRNLGNTGQFSPPTDEAAANNFDEPNADAIADYNNLRNQYLAQLGQQQQQQFDQAQQTQQPDFQPEYTPQQTQYQPQLSTDQEPQEASPDSQKDKKKKTSSGRFANNIALRTAMAALQQLIALIMKLVGLALKLIPFILGLLAKAATWVWGFVSSAFAAAAPFIMPILTVLGVAALAAGLTALAAGAVYLFGKGLEFLFNLGKGILEFGANAISGLFNGISSLFTGGSVATTYAFVAVASGGAAFVVSNNMINNGMYLLTDDSLDLETSKYIEIDKKATPTRIENNTPTEIKYTITIKAKDEYVVTPKLDTITDTFSNIGKVTGLPDEVAHNQAVKDALQAKLAETQNKITNSGVTIEYSLPALSGEDVFVVNTFKLDFSVVDTQAEGSPTIEDSWKDSASIRIGDPTFSDCFVFVDSNTPETEKIAAAKARIGTREGGIASIVDWPDEEITTLLAAFSTRVTENTGFMSSLKCDESSEFGPILLFRLKANGILYGGWSIDENAIGFFDETFNYSLTSTEYTVIHELGHTIDKRNAQFRTRFDSQNTIEGLGCPPTYNIATCTATEPFAEAIALFVIYPDYTFNLGGPTRTTYNFPALQKKEYCAIKEIVFGDDDVNNPVTCP